MNYTLLIRPPQILHRPIKMIAPRNSVITIINQFYLILETASHYNYCIVSYFYSRWKKIKVNDIEQLLLQQVYPLFIYFYSGSNWFHIVLKILCFFTNENTFFSCFIKTSISQQIVKKKQHVKSVILDKGTRSLR